MDKNTNKTKRGFTIIEVMLVLAITGLMLIGVLGNTYSSIKSQRYNDAVVSFAESLRQVYNEVLSPRSRDDESGASDLAIYGKALIFNGSSNPGVFQTVTLVGDAKLDESKDDEGFIKSLGVQNVAMQCETLSEKNLFWEAQAFNSAMQPFSGMILIARSPRSGAIHTAMTDVEFGIVDESSCESGNTSFRSMLGNGDYIRITTEPITFCVKSDESSVMRAVQIATDGSNSSAVSVLNEEDSRNAGCQ